MRERWRKVRTFSLKGPYFSRQKIDRFSLRDTYLYKNTGRTTMVSARTLGLKRILSSFISL